MEEREIISSEAPRMSENEQSSQFSFDKLSFLLLRFLNQLKKTGRSTNTIASYRRDLTLFCEFLLEKQINPALYSFPTNEYWLHFLKENGRSSAASTRRAQMSVRTFLHFLVNDNIIAGSPLLEIKSPKQPKHALLIISQSKYQHLCATLKTEAQSRDEKAVRDWCMVLLIGECGLKSTEAATLSWGDIWLDESLVADKKFGGSLRVPGPNERLVPFSHDLKNALALLQEARMKLSLSCNMEEKLFFGFQNINRSSPSPALHRHGIKFVLYEVCQRILKIPYNSESLRNHAIMRWVEQNLGNEKVAELAGYSSLNSLERFLQTSRAKRQPKRKIKKR